MGSFFPAKKVTRHMRIEMRFLMNGREKWQVKGLRLKEYNLFFPFIGLAVTVFLKRSKNRFYFQIDYRLFLLFFSVDLIYVNKHRFLKKKKY